jgi:hypothetical protein
LPPEQEAIELPPPEEGPEPTLRRGRVLAMLASQDDATGKSAFHAMYVDTSESQLRGIDTDLPDLMAAA